ncbi:hypothetical protein L484_003258 [Morus notabilis]|uniref:Transcription factor IIIC 90kDa subunit N-terminal domain-containing protein n=1 Tax=Morus notabilis TaxID=981085 RepID=W9RI48_9ROSA|nr:hypothetical protein L484_003258 [Morus notabilis]
MASRFQAATLVAAPSHPNAVAWSDENLIAVASGHLVTILNPASPLGPRGLITLQTGEPFPIGVVERADLLSASLLPTCLSRDTRPCVRSISWSPLGLAPNSGCLLAVCTTEGRVKLYRQPFCDFCAEWIEMMDISTRLFEYLESVSFGELEVCPSKDYEHDVLETDIGQVKRNSSKQIVSASKSKASAPKKTPKNCTLPLISADRYAAHSAMLSSLVIAWSPVLQLSAQASSIPQNGSSISLLAVGGKSGEVSFWRVSVPECYSVELNQAPTDAMILGLVQAHASWVTAISWVLLDPKSSNPRVLLTTGSSDGSVKIWLAYNEELLKSKEVNHTCFSLLKEVVTIDIVPVSVISLTAPAQSPNKMLLAIGKGSGSFEVWNCDISDRKFDKFGSYNDHDHVITGLAWAFDGRSLYSCSQDNFVRNWIWSEDMLSEAPIPSNTPRLRSSAELPDACASCFGLAVSPGNVVIAMIRNFDEDLLDPMYQKRTQKAAVEFFWIGAQEVRISSNEESNFTIPGFPVNELVSWEANILWSLKQYEYQTKPMVVWDIIAALLAFKRFAAEYVEHILVKWLSLSYVGSHMDLSAKKVLSHVLRILSKISSRHLHLLNIICRRVVLSEMKADQINSKLQNLEEIDRSEEKLIMWIELLLSSERELRTRLVGLSFSAGTNLMSCSTTVSPRSGNWFPVGLAQMKQWVALPHDYIPGQLRVLASEVWKHEKRLSSECAATEQCCYCSAPVPFESPEVAFCQGVDQRHKLARCAVSMEICPTTPIWFCSCCHRQVYRLAPETLFTLLGYPSDFKSSAESSDSNVSSKPLCPFCGILLQRLQPDFLLSASPV